MENTKMNIFATALELNSHFAKKHQLNGEQIGVELYEKYETLCKEFGKALYNTIAHAQNFELNEATDLTNVFNTLRPIRELIGDVNGLPRVYKTEDVLEWCLALAPYILKDGSKYAPPMQLAKSDVSLYDKQVKMYEKTPGVNPKALEEAKANLEKAKAEVERLGNLPDMELSEPQNTYGKTFRHKFEQFLGRHIRGQATMTYEEIEALKAERKAERKANRSAKRQAEAKAKAESETK